jgi:hypothetical protein
MFDRVLSSCNIHEGDKVKIKGTSKKGTVIKKYLTPEECQWDKNRPQLLVVAIGEDHFAAHPSQVKRISK